MIAHLSTTDTTHSSSILQNSRAQKKAIVALFCLLVLCFSVIMSSFSTIPSAFADNESDAKDTVSKALDSYAGDQKDFASVMGKFNQEGDNPDTFAHVMQRMFVPGYLNKTPKGVAGKGYEARSENCRVDDPNAGTPLYHNCDVPNIVSEFIQTTVSSLVPQGIMNGTTDYAKIENQWFGLPSKVPGGSVPSDPSLRTSKYTGLELYGYPFKLTSYNGEWDNIKVFSSARAMSNFGFMDNLNLGVSTVVNGISGGLQQGASNAGSALSQGDLIGAIGGAFGGFFEGSISSSLNTVLDSSDLNVFNSQSWYRVGYGATAYGFRELTNAEASERMLQKLRQQMSHANPVKLPDDFVKLKGGPPHPNETIASCIVTDSSGKDSEKGGTQGTGISREQCETEARNVNPSNPKFKYSVDGKQKAQSIKDWKESNKDWFESAKKYDITCNIDDNEEKRTDNLSSFYGCIDSQYAEKAKSVLQKAQDENTSDWVKNTITPESFSKLLAGSSSANINSARARLVCTDANGIDKTDASGPVYAYNDDGTFNTACGSIRPPVQNGLFGNGYDPQNSVQPDTRRTALNDTPLGITTPDRILLGTVSNMGISFGQFMTRMANALVNLSFSPLTKTLGIDGVVEKFIKDFRSSVFMGFCALVVSATALLIFLDTMRRKRYMQGFSQLAYVVMTYVIGIIVLWHPQSFLKMVDEIPATVESAIATSIFDAGSDKGNNICQATGDAKSYTGEKQDLFSYAEDGNREMMCAVWQNYALNAWTNAQFGTDYSKLYSSGSGNEVTFNNKNGDLVGDASVDMGGSVIEKNWALYQLQHMTIGTTTTLPVKHGVPVGQIDPSMYRLVDLQAGPNNGADSDSSHFDWWRGAQPAGRAAFASAAGLNSLVGFIAIAIFSVNKIILTFITILMFLALPFVLLVGLFYHGGRNVLAKYSWTIVSLVIERIMAVVMLAIMLRMITLASRSVDNYIMAVIFSIGIAIASILLRKKILTNMRTSLTARYGGTAGGSLTQFNAKTLWDKAAPKTVKNTVKNGIHQARAYGGGALAGVAIGGTLDPSKLNKYGRQSASDQARKDFNRDRREGFGLGQKVYQSSRVGEGVAKKSLKDKDGVIYTHTSSDVSQALSDRLKEIGVANTTKNSKGKTRAVSVDIDKSTAPQRRKLAQAMQAMAKAERAKDRGATSGNKDAKSKSIRQNPTLENVQSEQEDVRNYSRGSRIIETRARAQYDKLIDHMAKQESSRLKAQEDREKFADSVNELFKNYQGPKK